MNIHLPFMWEPGCPAWARARFTKAGPRVGGREIFHVNAITEAALPKRAGCYFSFRANILLRSFFTIRFFRHISILTGLNKRFCVL
jgi:hypothetical protein